MKQLFFVLGWSLLAINGFAQLSNRSTLHIDSIMKGESFVGVSPSNISWSEDGRYIYFDWNPNHKSLSERYQIDVTTADKKPKLLELAELKELMPSNGVYNKAFSKKLYVQQGDLFIYDVATKSSFRITNTTDAERSPRFDQSEQKVVYQAGLNLFAWDIKTGQLEQLTDFSKGLAAKEAAATEGLDKWLEEDQLSLFEVLRERQAKSKERQAFQDQLKPKKNKTIYLDDWSLESLQISPDLRFVVYRLSKSATPKPTSVPDFVTNSGYTQPKQARSKVGSPQDRYKSYIYDRMKDTSYAVKVESIPGIYDKPVFFKEYHANDTTYKATYGNPREVIIHGPQFSEDSKAVVDIKAMDNKDRWVMLLDLPTGVLKLLDRQHDDAWIGGPGIESWNGVAGAGGWINDQTYWFQSEESGFSHLYKADVKDLTKKQLTAGKYEVTDAFLSKDKKHFYLTTSEVDFRERHFYKMSVDGGPATKLTNLPGNSEVTISPNEQQLAIRYSTANRPWELYLQANEPNAKASALTDSRTELFKKYNWRTPEFVYFKAADGAMVPARLYKPEKAKKGGAAVIFVHGAGYLQNAHKWWSNYYREYMFHNMLVDNGYTVLDIDFRASAGYGRDWRTAIYRHMGGKDLSDQVDGAKYLVKEHGVAVNRIGIYGGSYGGFITLMAMFTAPETFQAGAALRSVTDWAHYNHPYTSNILNTPLEDSIAYRRSSPIYFADGLKGKLLILHGMVDMNVQFQDVVRLSQKLIELKKENWELAVFPVEDHGFVEPSSWSDEYKRIFKLFQETIGDLKKY